MPNDPPQRKAKSWRNRAKNVRAKADQLKDPRLQAVAAIIADTYERVAHQIEQRSRGAGRSK